MKNEYKKTHTSSRTAKPKPTAAKKRKNALKKGVLAVCTAFVVLGILCGALAGIRHALRKEKTEPAPKTPALAGKNYINFYEPDYGTDIFTDKDYLAKNRTIRYVIPHQSGNSSLVLDEYKPEELTEGQRFFVRYFDALAHGDTDAYHTFFADEYVNDPAGFETHPTDRVFPMQRVYDITVTELGRTSPTDTSYTYNGVPAVFGVYEVRYKILKNDGELRYDLPEDGENPLVFELVSTGVGTADETTVIKAQYKYTDISAS